jgi:hypothetical protein
MPKHPPAVGEERVDERRYRVFSLQIDEARLAAMWRMSPDERRAAAIRGELSLGEMLKWASRHPDEVPRLHGEFFFIAVMTPDLADADEPPPPSPVDAGAPSASNADAR